MANENNLKPFTAEQSHEQAVKNGRKGGRASVKARRKKKTMSEAAKLLIGMDISEDDRKIMAELKKMGITDENTQYSMAIVVSMLNQAVKGNVKAADWLVKMCGENPTDILQNNSLEMERQRLEFEIIKEENKVAADEPEATNDNFLEAFGVQCSEIWEDCQRGGASSDKE